MFHLSAAVKESGDEHTTVDIIGKVVQRKLFPHHSQLPEGLRSHPGDKAGSFWVVIEAPPESQGGHFMHSKASETLNTCYCEVSPR